MITVDHYQPWEKVETQEVAVFFPRNLIDLLPLGGQTRSGPGAFGHRPFQRSPTSDPKKWDVVWCYEFTLVRRAKLKVGQVCPSPVQVEKFSQSALIRQRLRPRLRPSAESRADFLDEVFQLSFFAHAVRQASCQEIHHDTTIQTTPGMCFDPWMAAKCVQYSLPIVLDDLDIFRYTISINQLSSLSSGFWCEVPLLVFWFELWCFIPSTFAALTKHLTISVFLPILTFEDLELFAALWFLSSPLHHSDWNIWQFDNVTKCPTFEWIL